ncbi:MAG: radical SAM protein [Spirochaetes bacterium]|nr:radical SAM protein [Spirochaetota bacterium]
MDKRNPWFEPSYLRLFQTGELKDRVFHLKETLESCVLCPHRCGVNRKRGELGRCRTGVRAVVSSASPHFGEERVLVGRGGSGTIFFSHCNMTCMYCQNYELSHLGVGREVEAEELARLMLGLQYQGCHNINFVSPTHVIPQILEGLIQAIPKGLRIPLVYNSGGYDSVETLRVLEDVFDIYMPDIKYGRDQEALELSGAPAYTKHAFAAVREMHRQVGDLRLNEQGIAYQGLLVRHLVLPDGIAHSEEVLDFLSQLSKGTWVNIMAQYHPCYQAKSAAKNTRYGGLGRRPTLEEVDRIVAYARSVGLQNAGTL